MKIKITFLLAFCFAAMAMPAQETPTQIIDTFFSKYAENPPSAVDYIFSLNEVFREKEKAQVDNVKAQLEQSLEITGEYYGYEFLVKKSLADCYELHSYIVRYSRQPVRFIFKMYKPKDRWITMGFSFDDDVLKELDKAAKIYYPNNQ